MARIPLRDRHGEVRAFAIVDDADFEWLNQWRWHLDGEGYARRSVHNPRRVREEHYGEFAGIA